MKHFFKKPKIWIFVSFAFGCLVLASVLFYNNHHSIKDIVAENLSSRMPQDIITTGMLAVPDGICDRTIQVQKALLAKAEKENCEQMTVQDLQAVVKLDLSGQNITQLYKANDFSNLTALQKLWLSNNDLKSLPVGVFSGLTSLQELYLGNNELESLPEGIFSGLTSLQELYFFNNHLESLPEGLFSGLTSLQRLYLHNNELASLPVGLFSGLTSLKRLDLDASFRQEEDRTGFF